MTVLGVHLGTRVKQTPLAFILISGKDKSDYRAICICLYFVLKMFYSCYVFYVV